MKVENKTNVINISRKHGFIPYFKINIMRLGLTAILFCTGTVISIFMSDSNIIKIFVSIPFIGYLTVSIVRFVTASVKYFKNHLYVPFSHKDIIYNRISNEDIYTEIMYSMFDFKPLSSAARAIKKTAFREFKIEMKELDLPSYLLYLVKNGILLLVYLIGLACFFCRDEGYMFIGLIILAMTVAFWELLNIDLKYR